MSNFGNSMLPIDMLIIFSLLQELYIGRLEEKDEFEIFNYFSFSQLHFTSRENYESAHSHYGYCHSFPQVMLSNEGFPVLWSYQCFLFLSQISFTRKDLALTPYLDTFHAFFYIHCSLIHMLECGNKIIRKRERDKIPSHV